jgi:hypothetical protein
MQLGALLRSHDLYRSRAAVRAYGLLRRAASRLGLQVVLRTFYSPIPDVDVLSAATFDRVSPLAGVGFDLDAQLRWARELAAPMAEFAPADAPGAEPAYLRGTEAYPLLDATVLYGMIRRLRPARVLELGSGASTLVITQALVANARRPTRAAGGLRSVSVERHGDAAGADRAAPRAGPGRAAGRLRASQRR